MYESSLMGTMERVLQEIERALRARHMSARQASIEAVGNAELVKRLRRGEVPTVERLAALCEVLELELYVGPPRDRAPVDEDRLGLAVETAVLALRERAEALRPGDLARLVVAAYALIGAEGSANAERVHDLIRIAAGNRE